MKKKEKRLIQGAVVIGLLFWITRKANGTTAPVKAAQMPAPKPQTAPANLGGCFHAAL